MLPTRPIFPGVARENRRVEIPSDRGASDGPSHPPLASLVLVVGVVLLILALAASGL